VSEALVQIVEAAIAESVRRSGPWIACRIGCTECCMGAFPISQDDAERLRRGMAALEPARAAHVRERARRASGADDEPCPALDPETGACELYAFRPLTCRLFGPAVHFRGGDIAVCELCYQGASEREVEACAVEIDAGEPEEDGALTAAGVLAG
jgi:Fe-S-cluster containining protein